MICVSMTIPLHGSSWSIRDVILSWPGAFRELSCLHMTNLISSGEVSLITSSLLGFISGVTVVSVSLGWNVVSRCDTSVSARAWSLLAHVPMFVRSGGTYPLGWRVALVTFHSEYSVSFVVPSEFTNCLNVSSLYSRIFLVTSFEILLNVDLCAWLRECCHWCLAFRLLATSLTVLDNYRRPVVLVFV